MMASDMYYVTNVFDALNQIELTLSAGHQLDEVVRQ